MLDMSSRAGRRKTLVFFSPDVSDVSTVKRAESFIAHGYDLLMFGFRRDHYNKDFRPTWPVIALGQTHDRRYGQRLAALLRAVPRLVERRRSLREAAIFYARNLDPLLLALLARALGGRSARIVYEVLDIQPAFVGKGLKARMLRAVERFGLRRIDLLVISSPGFLRNYFRSIQGYQGRWFLLENKLPENFTTIVQDHPAMRATESAEGDRGRYRWVVGYCGLIRGQETFDLIVRLAERLEGLVLFKFHGVITSVDRRSFTDAVERLENVVYEGDYVNPRDLPDIYRHLDFAWAIDLENRQHNSRWLLPCRFYEAGYFGVPCLAARGFEVGALVEQRGVGWSFDEPYEDALARFFMRLTQAEYDETRRRLQELPPTHFVAGEDTAELLQSIEDA